MKIDFGIIRISQIIMTDNLISSVKHTLDTSTTLERARLVQELRGIVARHDSDTAKARDARSAPDVIPILENHISMMKLESQKNENEMNECEEAMMKLVETMMRLTPIVYYDAATPRHDSDGPQNVQISEEIKNWHIKYGQYVGMVKNNAARQMFEAYAGLKRFGAVYDNAKEAREALCLGVFKLQTEIQQKKMANHQV